MSWNLLGHDWAVRLLQGQIARGRTRHAYLFTGPAGVGRRTLALRFAQAIHCEAPVSAGDPCGSCSVCQASNHPDLTITAPDDETGVLKVDQIRDLQRTLSLSPYAASYRIAVLLQFERANISAANAFLKTLEEPPPRVILLLTAESPESLPETILSRCQLLRLRPLPVDELANRLVEVKQLPVEEARQVAHIAGGRPGRALQLIEMPEAREQRAAWLDEHRELLSAQRTARFQFAEKAAKNRVALQAMLELWASLWRDVLILSAGSQAPLTNIDRLEEIQFLAKQISYRQAHTLLKALEAAREHLDHNANTTLTAESLLLKLPRVPAAVQ